MKKKLMGSYYPKCNSEKRTYNKRSSFDGEFTIENNNLVFNRRILMLFRTEDKSVSIPLNEIEKVETMNLNGAMPFGVCVFTKDGTEYMFGHVHNQKLKQFILDAKDGNVEEYTAEDRKKSNIKKGIVSIIVIILLLLVFFIVDDFSQEDIVKREVEKINGLNFEEEEIDMTIYSKDEYGKVEQALKEYYKDYYDYTDKYYDNSPEGVYQTIFDQYVSTKGELDNQILEVVEENKQKAAEASKQILEILQDDKSLEYIEKYSLDSYYVDFYKQQIEFDKNKDYTDEWNVLLEEDSKKEEYLMNMIHILIENKGKWTVEEDLIYFEDEDVLNEFQKNYDLLYEIEE